MTPPAVRRLLAGALAVLLIVLLFPCGAQAGEQTTVLGLYMQWQSEGTPPGVEEVFYDSETGRLVVVLEPDAQPLAEELQQAVGGSEELELRFSQPEEESAEEAAAKRRKGVLALAGGYLGAIAILALFLFARRKTGNQENTGQRSFFHRR